jgi:hypothetical protein
MNRLLDSRKVQIRSATSPLSFETTGSDTWKEWDRYIAIEGQNMFHIGNVCGTCAFIFSKIGGNNKVAIPDLLVEQLHDGISKITKQTIKALSPIIPNGLHEVILLTVRPKLALVGSTDDYFSHELVDIYGIDEVYGAPKLPNISYYRGSDEVMDNESTLFEFFIPLTSIEHLDRSRIDHYKEQIINGKRPTAISLGMLETKTPSIFKGKDIKYQNDCHWCNAHYLIDGHHKIKAASELNAEITLISFISTEKGMCNTGDLLTMIKVLDKRTSLDKPNPFRRILGNVFFRT